MIFMGKWPVAHLRSSKCQQLPYCDIFKKCPPAAFIITNSKVKRRASNQPKSSNSVHSLQKVIQLLQRAQFQSLGWKKTFEMWPEEPGRDEKRHLAWREAFRGSTFMFPVGFTAKAFP